MSQTQPSAVSIQDLWKSLEFKPNARQEEAILNSDGPLYLPAGPGSGKTRVLLWRVLNLIVYREIKPEQIFLSTFTEKAALQLRDGLRALLAIVTAQTGVPYDISKLYVGTVHSLCRRILTDRRFSSHRERTRVPILLDELSQYMYLRRGRRWAELLSAGGIVSNGNSFINACFQKPSVSRHNAIEHCISFFNRLSEEVIDPSKAKRIVADPNVQAMLTLYEAYLGLLNNGDPIPRTDLSLLQQRALERLERNPASGMVFEHVIVDEYQDTNTVQEQLFFRVASGRKNICVVGDDDQALYRFRGATVENFVDFPARCQDRLGLTPHKIVLSRNYRSRRRIVKFYTDFISHRCCDWRKRAPARGFYRVVDKAIEPDSDDDGPSVVASSPAHPIDVAAEVADLVRKIIAAGKVNDPNEIAFLFPSLKSPHVDRMSGALERNGLSVYAPRAGRFLAVGESMAMFGMFFHIFGRMDRGNYWGADYQGYYDWVDQAHGIARRLMDSDKLLERYVDERRAELIGTQRDFNLLAAVCGRQGWNMEGAYDPDLMKPLMENAKGISLKTHRSLASRYFDAVARRRRSQGHPFTVKYVVTRATSLDWNVLDLFYQLCGFDFFRVMFKLAESGKDEGPICNLSLISQYLSKFMDEYLPIISGEFLSEQGFLKVFNNYLYILFRRGESEYEYSEDPFPKGRIPFITIHQAKGLEFPVVVLANPRKDDKGPQLVERMVNPLLSRAGEPLDSMSGFDIMRMFYVALSRAKNLLIIAHFSGRGQRINEPFGSMLNANIPLIRDFDVGTLPTSTAEKDDLPQNYSYTGDFLSYRTCPRQYMIFRKYGFVPSRSQTMFFGSLVHQTLEDLHQLLIFRRINA